MNRTGTQPVLIGKDEIHVFVSFVDACQDVADLDLHQGILEPHELSKASRFHFERDRRRYLLTRTLARTVLSRYVSIPPEGLRFAANAYGRPAIADRPDRAPVVQFNISHTAGLVALAVAQGGQVGIDVENVGARDVMLEIADRFFAPLEAAELRSLPLPERKRRFLEYWTLKESYIKARGMGLSLDLRKFAFRLSQGPVVILDVEPGLGESGDRWRFWQFEAPPDYLFALCAERFGDRPQRLRFSAIVPWRSEREFRPVFIREPDIHGRPFPQISGGRPCSQ